MPDKPSSLPVSPESLDRKHEVSEKQVRNVLIIGGAAWFLVVFSLAACGMTIYLLAQTRPMQHMQSFGIILSPNLKPLERFPKPDLQTDDDHAQRLGSDAAQSSYGWVDRSHGILHIPIDRAMDLILQRGLPAATNSSPQTDGSTLQLIQKVPDQQ